MPSFIDADARDKKICPFCGAWSTRQCEIEDEDAGVECAWWADAVREDD